MQPSLPQPGLHSLTLTDIHALSDTFTGNRKGQQVSPSQAHSGPTGHGPGGQGLPSAASWAGSVLGRHSLHGSSEAARAMEPGFPLPWLAWKHTFVLISSFPVLLCPSPPAPPLPFPPHPSGITSQNQSPCLTDSALDGGRGRLKQTL